MTNNDLLTRALCGMVKRLSLDTAEAKQLRSLFRRSAASDQAAPEAIGWIFEKLPEELAGKGGKLNHAEEAAYLTLCVFSCCRGSQRKGVSFVKALRLTEENPQVEKDRDHQRLARIEMAESLEEMRIPLLLLAKYITAKDQDFDYVKLAGDLYNFQFNRMGTVRKWEREFVDFNEKTS